MLFLSKQFHKINIFGCEFEIRYDENIGLLLQYKNILPKKISSIDNRYILYSTYGSSYPNALKLNKNTAEYKEIEDIFIKACNREIEKYSNNIKNIENVRKKNLTNKTNYIEYNSYYLLTYYIC